MSFWDNVKKFAQPYADDYDDEYDDDVPGDFDDEDVSASRFGRRSAPETTEEEGSALGFDVSSAFSSSAASVPAAAPSAGFSGQVVNMGGSKQQVVVFRPVKFEDSTRAANDLRSRKAVIVNMENVDKAMARRVVDFLSGCAFALDGNVTKVAQSTYLFSPYNMEVSGDALENLQSEVDSYI